jgi:hypothetical protein
MNPDSGTQKTHKQSIKITQALWSIAHRGKRIQLPKRRQPLLTIPVLKPSIVSKKTKSLFGPDYLWLPGSRFLPLQGDRHKPPFFLKQRKNRKTNNN